MAEGEAPAAMADDRVRQTTRGKGASTDQAPAGSDQISARHQRPRAP